MESGQDPDPAEVGRLILAQGKPFVQKTTGKTPAHAVINAAYGFLVKQPASAKLRAAVFRFLAGQDGLRNAGIVTDLNGRKVIALASRNPSYAGTTVDTELLLDPATYQVLGNQDVLVTGNGGPETAGMKPGTVFRSEVVVELGWTDQTPHHG